MYSGHFLCFFNLVTSMVPTCYVLTTSLFRFTWDEKVLPSNCYFSCRKRLLWTKGQVLLPLNYTVSVRQTDLKWLR